MELAPGSVFGPYRVVERLGSGGMASVYKAYEASLDRHVALKVVHGAFLGDPSFAERFRQEAKVVARLEHPHIVPVHAFGVEQGVPWMAMRLVTGGAVDSLLREQRLPPAEAVRIVSEIGSALDYAHAKGVVHRDVKPQNMLLDSEGRVYLADFGIARLLEGSAHLTATGMIQGTPAYMAPEQATGQTVDARADVYALGVVAYEALTGHVPFTGTTPVSILMKHVSEPVPRPPVAELSAALAAVIERSLAKKPEERWSSASEFTMALEAALIPTVPAVEVHTYSQRVPPPLPPAPATVQALPRWALPLGLAAVAIIGVSGLGIAFLLTTHPFGSSSRPGTTPAASIPAVLPRDVGPTPAPGASPNPPTLVPSPSTARGWAVGPGRVRVYCEATPRGEMFGRVKLEDVTDSVQDVKRAIARRGTMILADSADHADIVLQVLERGRNPPVVGLRQVRMRLVFGSESVALQGQEGVTGFNTWSGAAVVAVERAESWVRTNYDRVMQHRQE